MGRAIVVGERTYGKGAALSLDLDPGTAEVRHRAAAEARLPSGAIVQGVGIQPDLEVPAECGAARTLAPAMDLALELAHQAAKTLQQQTQR